MLDYEQTAKNILLHVGGISNFNDSKIHETGIKIVVKDPRLADMTALERIEGISRVHNMYDSIILIITSPQVRSIAGALDRLVASERYQEKKKPVAKTNRVKQRSTSIEDATKLFCPICKNRLYYRLSDGRSFCQTCKKLVYVGPIPYLRNAPSVNNLQPDRYKAPLNVSTTNEQSNTVIINNYNIHVENLNINGLTFNQIIQCNSSNQQIFRTLTDRVVVVENFIIYITKRVQYNNEMAWDVIVILKADTDKDIRSIGDSMQRELNAYRNPLAKLRNWILQHKEDVDVAKKFFDALSSAANFAQKWGPWLANIVGL